MHTYFVVLLITSLVGLTASVRAQDVSVEAGAGLGNPSTSARPAPTLPVAPPRSDPRAERVLAMLAVEVLCVAATVGVGLGSGAGGGRNGLEGGGLAGALIGTWLVAPIAVQLTGGLVSGRGSLGGAVVGLLVGAAAAGLLTGLVMAASSHLDDPTLGALFAIDGALALAGPLIGYEVSHDEARRSDGEPRFAPAIALGPNGFLATLRIAM